MKKVLVIGDSCSDVFRYGRCERLSPEAPVPIMKLSRTTGNGGMAINVFENLKALGVDCDLVTNDIRPVKTRYVDEVSNQLLLRVDESDDIRPIENLDKIDFNQYEVVVISDYNKGYLSENDILYITNNHPLVFIAKEYAENQKYLCTEFPNDVIVTIGTGGAVLNTLDNVFEIEKQHEVRDLSGAGDTFLAGLVADYVNNSDICSAIRFANRCAAWVVSQKGVAVVNPEKI